MKFIIKILLYFQYLFYKIFIFLFPIDGFDVLINYKDKTIIKNFFFYVNFIKHFHLLFRKPNSEKWIVRLNLNNHYFINHYDNNEVIYYMLDDNEWKNNNLISFKVNDKNINIVKYNYNCLIKDILDFELDKYNDEDKIQCMNLDFDDIEYIIKDVKDKQLKEL